MSDCDTEVSSSTDIPLPSTSMGVENGQAPIVIAQAVDRITASQTGEIVLADANSQMVTTGNQAIATTSTDEASLVTDPSNPIAMVAIPDQAHTSMVSSSDAVAMGNQGGGCTIITNQDQSVGSSQDHVILTADQSGAEGISVADNSMLQGLLSAPGATAQLATANGDTIQIIAVNNPSDLTGQGKIWQVLPTVNSSEIATIIAVNQTEGEAQEPSQLDHAETQVTAASSTQVVDMVPVSSSAESQMMGILLGPPPTHPHPQDLPPGCPSWAARLHDCEKIGDAFRGWVESEVELDLLLTYHKQQTQSFWGTRQSPSPAKQSTRLMWKSQYVPFDGLPFVNAGSRAVVMECQYGPRRKGAQIKKHGDPQAIKPDFKQTCPARIYIKKVKKFPEYAVDLQLDKKSLKMAMDKAFMLLKERGIDKGFGQERFYVQLPTEKAHEFHVEGPEIVHLDLPKRLHPRVTEKIRELVSAGETRLYCIRKALRRFVERELFGQSMELVPEKHNLTYYPTVNDLQNHIHQAIRDIEAGLLPVSAQTVNVEVVTSGDSSSQDGSTNMWQHSANSGQPHAETVTVTLTQNPGEDGHHVISRVETHLSDGTTRVSTTLTPETAQLLSKLHPNIFPSGSLLQVQQQQHGTTACQIQADSIATDSMATQVQTTLTPSGDHQEVLQQNAEQILMQGEEGTQTIVDFQMAQPAGTGDASDIDQRLQVVEPEAHGELEQGLDIMKNENEIHVTDDAQFIQMDSVIAQDQSSVMLEQPVVHDNGGSYHGNSEHELDLDTKQMLVQAEGQGSEVVMTVAMAADGAVVKMEDDADDGELEVSMDTSGMDGVTS